MDGQAVNSEKLIDAFVMLRDQRSELGRAFEEADDLLKRKQSVLKQAMLKNMESVGSTQLKGANGVAYRQIKRIFSCADWPNFWAFIKENDRFDMMQKRVGEKAVSEFLEETEELPPGINMMQEYEVVIRRS